MEILKTIFQKGLNYIYPPVCGICGKLNDEFLCQNCFRNLKKIENKHIHTFHTNNIYYHELFYLFSYQGIIRQKILEYKFFDASYLAKTFEKIILNDQKICEFIKSYDIIVPVPIHPARKWERGYNQSSLIIKGVINKIRKDKEIQFSDNILVKERNTKSQSTLNQKERKTNLIGAYRINENHQIHCKRKNILIFDDIYTTGSTVNECAKVLHKEEAKRIGVLTLAKD